MRLRLIGLSAATAFFAFSGAAVAQQPTVAGDGTTAPDTRAPTAMSGGTAAGSSEDDSKMPPLPSMEGQQGEVISRTAVSLPLRKKHPEETAAPEKAHVSDAHPKAHDVATGKAAKGKAKGKAKAKRAHKSGRTSAKSAHAHRAPGKRTGRHKHH